MSIKFQYNKTALQNLNKQLSVRLRALPVLKNKEAALRFEVKKAKDRFSELKKELDRNIEFHSFSVGLWNEFVPELITISDVEIKSKKIAGVKIPIMEKVLFKEKTFSLFDKPKWFPVGISFLKDITAIVIEQDFFSRKIILLEQARRRTTQKVNLYEKVQIPGYENAILKIKRFLEDEENLSKSAQKIVKKRHQKQTEEDE